MGAVGLLLWVALVPSLANAAVHEPILGLAVEARVDDDVSAGGASESMAKLSPLVGWRSRGERFHVEGDYALDLVHHLEGSNLTFDHRGHLEARALATRRLTLRAQGGLYRVQDTSTLPRFGIARVPGGALWASWDLGAAYRVTETAPLEAGYLGDVTRLYDRHAPTGVLHSASVHLREAVTRRVELGLRGRTQIFAGRTNPFAEGYAASGTARLRLTRHSFFAVEAGGMLYHRDGSVVFVPRGRAQLGLEGRRFDLGLEASRDTYGAAGFASAIWADSLYGAFAFRPIEPLGVWIGGGFFRNGVAPDRELTAQGYGATTGAEWRVVPGLTARLAFDHIGQLDESGRGLAMARNIVSLRLAYRTP